MFATDSCRPIRGFVVYRVLQPRVFTRGYNMPSLWDYGRLKTVLQTHRVKNVNLRVKGSRYSYPQSREACHPLD